MEGGENDVVEGGAVGSDVVVLNLSDEQKKDLEEFAAQKFDREKHARARGKSAAELLKARRQTFKEEVTREHSPGYGNVRSRILTGAGAGQLTHFTPE